MLIDSVDEFLKVDLLSVACKVPVQRVEHKIFTDAGIELVVRRDDLIDQDLSGNKFYK